MQGAPARSQPPQPLLTIMRGFNHSPTLANLWQGLKEKVAAATTFSGFGKVDYVDLERDSAMLKQVWHCSCCLLGSQSFRPTGEPWFFKKRHRVVPRYQNGITN